jgi:hypothetical protein
MIVDQEHFAVCVCKDIDVLNSAEKRLPPIMVQTHPSVQGNKPHSFFTST